MGWDPKRETLRAYLIDQFGADNISVWRSGCDNRIVYVRDDHVATLFRTIMESYLRPMHQVCDPRKVEKVPRDVFLKRLNGEPR